MCRFPYSYRRFVVVWFVLVTFVSIRTFLLSQCFILCGAIPRSLVPSLPLFLSSSLFTHFFLFVFFLKKKNEHELSNVTATVALFVSLLLFFPFFTYLFDKSTFNFKKHFCVHTWLFLFTSTSSSFSSSSLSIRQSLSFYALVCLLTSTKFSFSNQIALFFQNTFFHFHNVSYKAHF